MELDQQSLRGVSAVPMNTAGFRRKKKGVRWTPLRDILKDYQSVTATDSPKMLLW
jgi:hypothetical protein